MDQIPTPEILIRPTEDGRCDAIIYLGLDMFEYLDLPTTSVVYEGKTLYRVEIPCRAVFGDEIWALFDPQAVDPKWQSKQ